MQKPWANDPNNPNNPHYTGPKGEAFKPYADGTPYIDQPTPTLQSCLDFAANAVVELRDHGGEDEGYQGTRDPVNERQFITGLARLYLSDRAPQPNGDNCARMDMPTLIDNVLSQAYRIAKHERHPQAPA